MESDAPLYGRGGGRFTLREVKQNLDAYLNARRLRPRRGASFCHDVLPPLRSRPAAEVDPLCD